MKDELNNIATALHEAGLKLTGHGENNCAFIGDARKDLRVVANRIEELEKAIACAIIISWKEDDLPDDKNMIMMIACEKVTKNLKEVYPLKVLSKTKEKNDD